MWHQTSVPSSGGPQVVLKDCLEATTKSQSMAMQRIDTNLMKHGFYVGGDCHLFFPKANEHTDETVDEIGTLHKSIVQENPLGLRCAVKDHSKFGWFLGV